MSSRSGSNQGRGRGRGNNTSNNSGRSSNGGRFRRHRNNNNNNSGSNRNNNKEDKKFLIGNKGQESFKKVQEDLITESNIKYGAEMAYVVLHLKEKPYDNIVLKAPTTTLAIIEDAKAKDLSAEAGTTSTYEDEARAQRQAEIEANKVVYNRELEEQQKLRIQREKDMGKLCGLIKQKLSDEVKQKLEEMDDYNDFQLSDPVRLLQEIKKICHNDRGDKYVPAIVIASIKQVGKTVQAFQQSNEEHMENIKARLDTFRDNLSKLLLEEDANYDNKSKEERLVIEDKAYEKLGAYTLIATAEHDLYKTCKQSMQR